MEVEEGEDKYVDLDCGDDWRFEFVLWKELKG